MARGLDGKPKPDTAETAPRTGATPFASGEESVNVTPEEQAQYEQFVTNGMQLLYSKETMPQVLEAIASSESPAEGLANALATLVMRLEDSAGKQGAEISGDVKIHGASEIMSQMVDLAKEAGVHEFKDDEVEQALYLALDIYRSTRQQEGKLPEEALQQDWQRLLEAEQQGTLDEVLPGIREYAERAPKPPGGQPAGKRRGLMR